MGISHYLTPVCAMCKTMSYETCLELNRRKNKLRVNTEGCQSVGYSVSLGIRVEESRVLMRLHTRNPAGNVCIIEYYE